MSSGTALSQIFSRTFPLVRNCGRSATQSRTPEKSELLIRDNYSNFSCSAGNCVKHGAGDVVVSCTYDPEPSNASKSPDPEDPPQDKPRGVLLMDISNRLKDINAPSASGKLLGMHQQIGNFSNGLGLGDMRDVCQRRNVPFSTFASDNRWHSVIELRASVTVATPTTETSFPPLPANLQVVIVDDQKMILRMSATLLRKRFAGIKVSTFRLNTLDSYKSFCASARKACTQWNILIVDQHFDYMHESGCMKHGTDLLKLVLDCDFKGCLVMHSGNTTGSDIATYSACGAHGTVGKGVPNFADELARIYDNFIFNNKNNKNKTVGRRKRSLSLDETPGADAASIPVKRRRRPTSGEVK